MLGMRNPGCVIFARRHTLRAHGKGVNSLMDAGVRACVRACVRALHSINSAFPADTKGTLLRHSRILRIPDIFRRRRRIAPGRARARVRNIPALHYVRRL